MSKKWGIRLLTAVGCICVVVAAAIAPAQRSEAANMSLFDPGYIISDFLFYNGSAMDAAGVQSFLNSQVGSCSSGATCLKDYSQSTTTQPANPMCSQYTGAASESAAQIIAKVGQACGISQKVILVTLQKEQGLVTSTSPSSGRYRTAMGFACPDTAACDTTYYGFFNQVYNGAKQLKRYGNPPGTSDFFTWYPVGGTTPVRYSPNAACGAPGVHIRNAATAALYYYTPYQPNPAALASSYGLGDACSSYGNRNFFSYFSDWFGSTTTVQPPFGNFEGATISNGMLNVAGWAIDPSSASTSISVQISLTDPTGGQGTRTVTANVSRPDVGAAYAGIGAGNAHGFSLSMSATALGQYTVCVTAIASQQGNGGTTDFGCKYIFNSLNGAPTVTRIAGDDRFATAAALSRSGYPGSGVPVVYIATGVNFADALAAAPAAAAQGGPLLLVEPGSVPAATKAELTRLAPKRIVVVGGASAVSDETYASLAAYAPAIQRIAGPDRFATSRLIAESVFGAAQSALVATGDNFPDALTAGAAAGVLGQPVILVDGFANGLDSATSSYLSSHKITKVSIVGGTAAVSAGIQQGLVSIGASVTRLEGADRFLTASAVNHAAFTAASTMYIASGVNYPDALAGAAIAAAKKSPLYVAMPGCVPRNVGQDILALGVRSVVVIGGTDALGATVASLEQCQ